MRRLAMIVGWLLLAAGPPVKLFGLVGTIDAVSGAGKLAPAWSGGLIEISNAAVGIVFTMVAGVALLLLAKIEGRLNPDKKK